MKLYDVIQKEQNKERMLEENKDGTKILEPSGIRSLKKKGKNYKRMVFFGSILTVVVFFYVLGIKLVRAKIIVEERVVPFVLDKTTFELPHEKEVGAKRLSFQTMRVSSEISREIFGSEFKEVTGKAKGDIIFLNEFSKTEQNIKMGTKLLGANGKTYQTQASVRVPGYTIDPKTKKKIPGSSQTLSAVATESGKNSNTTGTTFSIVGTTGNKKQQLYARSVSPFTGGEAGVMHTVSDAEKEKVVETLKTQLSERLKRETRAQIPEDLIAFPSLQFVSINTDALKLTGEGIKFPATIGGSMTSYLISRPLFEQAIAREVLREQTYPDVAIPSLDRLNIQLETAIPVNSGTPPDVIKITVSGEGAIVARVPEEKLKTLLVGGKKGNFQKVIEEIPEIENAKLTMFPFWSPFFPKKERYIQIVFK